MEVGESEGVLDEFGSEGGHETLGVELDCLDGEFGVADSHDLVVVGAGGDDEFARERGFVDGEGVVSGDLKWRGESREEALIVVRDGGGLAMHQAAGGDDEAT